MIGFQWTWGVRIFHCELKRIGSCLQDIMGGHHSITGLQTRVKKSKYTTHSMFRAKQIKVVEPLVEILYHFLQKRPCLYCKNFKNHQCTVQQLKVLSPSQNHQPRPFSFFSLPMHQLFVCSTNYNAQLGNTTLSLVECLKSLWAEKP